MRVMIEIDLPDGQRIPTAEDIKKLTDPNWISDWWHIDDVKGLYEDDTLSDEQCQEVLRRIDKYKDASQGINWETIQYVADAVLSEEINDPS